MMSRLFPILLIAIAGVIFFAYINPTYTGAVANLQGQIKSYDDALTAAARFNDKENQIVAEESALPADGVARVSAFLPDGVDNVQLILDLNSLATRSGLTLSNFDIKSSPAAGSSQNGAISVAGSGNTESLDLSVSAVGTYNALRTFLSGVESSLRLLDLVGLKVQDSATGVYTYSMTFRIYWLR